MEWLLQEWHLNSSEKFTFSNGLCLIGNTASMIKKGKLVYNIIVSKIIITQ